MNVSRAAFVVHTGKPAAIALAARLEERLRTAGVEVGDRDPDLVLSLGGDGTMLRAARSAHAADAPLLGINLGTLGYLTEVTGDDAAGALDEILEGRHRIEERMMLACRAPGIDHPDPFVGLNEVLVERASGHRLVRLGVRIGGESLAAFNADGVIVASPTGSTAYALSAGGPIVSPGAACIVVVPVSPHMIFSRPFVLPADENVEITIQGESELASLSLDGDEGYALGPGVPVTVGRHERPLRLVRLGGPGFLERLRSKLDLPS